MIAGTNVNPQLRGRASETTRSHVHHRSFPLPALEANILLWPNIANYKFTSKSDNHFINCHFIYCHFISRYSINCRFINCHFIDYYLSIIIPLIIVASVIIWCRFNVSSTYLQDDAETGAFSYWENTTGLMHVRGSIVCRAYGDEKTTVGRLLSVRSSQGVFLLRLSPGLC